MNGTKANPSYKTWRDRTHYACYRLREKYSVSEIAKMFGANHGTVGSWIKRGEFLKNYQDKTGEYIGAGYLANREGF